MTDCFAYTVDRVREISKSFRTGSCLVARTFVQIHAHLYNMLPSVVKLYSSCALSTKEIYTKEKGMHVYAPFNIEVMNNLIAFMSKVKSATRCCNDMMHDKVYNRVGARILGFKDHRSHTIKIRQCREVRH